MVLLVENGIIETGPCLGVKIEFLDIKKRRIWET